MASPSLLCLLSLFSLIFSAASSSSHEKPATITLPLSKFTKSPSSDPWQMINHLVSVSLARAHHLKLPHRHTNSLLKTPLFPHSYGGYSISLSFGNPPQTLSLIMDTGSSLVWFPCTKRYVCSNCSFPSIKRAKIPTFIPKLSSSSNILGCTNPKCGWVYKADVRSRCRDCKSNSGNCTETCPPYLIQYGSGATAGLLLSETLDFPKKSVHDFVVGCSIFSSRQPAGIAGFGRGRISLPSQMGLKKFSYCLLSHLFDDQPESSNLVLDGGSNSSDGRSSGLSYTRFHKNPVGSNSAFLDYYYVTLRKIIVGGKHVKIPYRFLVPGSDGKGGTIVDSGSTFTFMDGRVFKLVASEFENQLSNYTRAAEVENLLGLQPCLNVSGDKSISIPNLIFQFKGGAKMVMPLANYFSFFGDSEVVCLTIVTDNVVGPGITTGPSIILGNYQQQNFYIEYDLENNRFGFRKQNCKSV